MKDLIEKLKEFNRTYNVKFKEEPSLLETKDYLLRFDLLKEELTEYLDACKDNDLTEIADALGDQLYILIGTILAHGMGNIIEGVFNEIHRSNMSKLDENGNPIFREDGKVLKGNNYSKPNINQFLK
jgi:predicted HAD superfamily Cof-like phosphohydrolase